MKHLGCRRICLIPLLLLLAPSVCFAQTPSASPGPAFTTDPEMATGFHELYAQHFPEARDIFTNWESSHPEDSFGPVAIAASYLFEELYRQNVLSSDFFLDQKRFLNGIEGKPDPARMANFRAELAKTRTLSRQLMKKNPKDPEALFGLTLAAGMESDADAILEKKQLDGLKRMKEANEYAKQLLALQPDTADAYVALGAANYIIGSLNPGYRMGLWFMGIHGDKNSAWSNSPRPLKTAATWNPSPRFCSRCPPGAKNKKPSRRSFFSNSAKNSHPVPCSPQNMRKRWAAPFPPK